MIIKNIKLKNIRSFENASIDFPLGSTVLSGDIGSGKTSVLLAIEFALFGLQPGQRGSGLLRNGKNEGSVTLEIEIDGKPIILERGLERKKSVNQSYTELTINNLKEEISITELKNKVLSLLNYPKEFIKKTNLLYRFTVYTPQEDMKQIILENPETRLDTLRHIFGIDKYKRINENTALFTMKLREQIRNYEGQIKDFPELEKKLEEKKVLVKDIEQKIEFLENEVKEKKELRQKAEEKLKELESKIEEKERYEREEEKTKIMLLGKKELSSEKEKEIFLLKKQIQDLEKTSFKPEALEEIEKQIELAKKAEDEKNKLYLEIFSKIKSLNSRIYEQEKLKEQISVLKLCPTCLQDVPEDYKSNIKRKFSEEIEKAIKEVLFLEKEKENLTKEINETKKNLEELRKKLDELRTIKIRLEGIKEKQIKLQEIEKLKLASEKDVLFLEKQIENLKEASSLLKKYEAIYEQAEKELKEAEKAEKAKEIEFASKEKEKELTLILIEEIKKEISFKEEIKKKLLYIQELEDFLSTSFLAMISFTERNIMLKLREEFSKLFNEWFNILVPEIFAVRLDEDFTPVIEQQEFQLDYSFLSGGERTAIALAYRLALNQVINSMLSRIKTRDLVILDEPTDGFSEQQLDKMRDVLNELKVKQLIIVSHESKIESFVESIIKFRKVEGITKVEA